MTGNDLVRHELGQLVADLKRELAEIPALALVGRAKRDRLIDYIDRLGMIIDGILQRENQHGIDR